MQPRHPMPPGAFPPGPNPPSYLPPPPYGMMPPGFVPGAPVMPFPSHLPPRPGMIPPPGFGLYPPRPVASLPPPLAALPMPGVQPLPPPVSALPMPQPYSASPVATAPMPPQLGHAGSSSVISAAPVLRTQPPPPPPNASAAQSFNLSNTQCVFINPTSDHLNRSIFQNAHAGLPLTIFFGALPRTLEDRVLLRLLECCGKVQRMVRPTDPVTQLPSNFCLVTYLQSICAVRALRLLPQVVLGLREAVGSREAMAASSVSQAERDAASQLPSDMSLVEDIDKPILGAMMEILTPAASSTAIADPPGALGEGDAVVVAGPSEPLAVAANAVANTEREDGEAVDEDVLGTKKEVQDYYAFLAASTQRGAEGREEVRNEVQGERYLQRELDLYRARLQKRDTELEEERRRRVQQKIKDFETQQQQQQQLQSQAQSQTQPAPPQERPRPAASSSNSSEDAEAQRRRRLQVLALLAEDAPLPDPSVEVEEVQTQKAQKRNRRVFGMDEDEDEARRGSSMSLPHDNDPDPDHPDTQTHAHTQSDEDDQLLEEEALGGKGGRGRKKQKLDAAPSASMPGASNSSSMEAQLMRVREQAQKITAALAARTSSAATGAGTAATSAASAAPTAVPTAAPPSSSSASSEQEQLRQLVAQIPNDPDALFAQSLSWELLQRQVLAQNLQPWVSRKVTDYLGSEEPSLTEFIMKALHRPGGVCARDLQTELSEVLETDAAVFVLKLWRMLVFYSRQCELGDCAAR